LQKVTAAIVRSFEIFWYLHMILIYQDFARIMWYWKLRTKQAHGLTNVSNIRKIDNTSYVLQNFILKQVNGLHQQIITFRVDKHPMDVLNRKSLKDKSSDA
jgi:hypothetical protein